MTQRSLDHYIRTTRKQSGLAQTDVARLLGYPSSSQVSLIEGYANTPKLGVAIALSLILDEPMESLFQGLYEQAQGLIQSHVPVLIKELEQSGTQQTRRQQQRITRLYALATNHLNKHTYGQEQ